ncbi:hypothetical protein E4U42_001072 [Claviceps africana]|uniref:Uncharacterized protein n=1 Tax=Claviceps africana TaxID=83212 RepID=A0A8K0NKI4_9HYPO|nr:hypothetical protein E4U42_001072 [Claviceps africana]
MSHGPPPPPPSGSFHGFAPFHQNQLSDAQNPQFTGSGHDGFDLMAFFDEGDMTMSLDAGPGASGMSMGDFAMSNGNGDMNMTNNSDAQDLSSTRSQDISMANAADNVPGAGPLPPGSFAQMSLSGNGGGGSGSGSGTSGNTSALTDFTKRRNWPAKVVEELKDFLHILDANGRIKYASSSILSISGYTAEEIQDVFLKDLIHPDDQGVFVSELHESISSGNPLRLFYRFKAKDGSYAIFETIGHAHIAAARFAPNPSNQSPFCQAVFVMSRPYPTKNAGLLDSFLEHKIENERLRRRIAELRREEEAETEESSRQWMQSQEGRSDMTPSEATGASTNATFLYRSKSSADDLQDVMNSALTRENLEGAVAARRSDSLGDKMARFEGHLHAETIEMLTGLRYLEGERSRGITTGRSSPTLIKGDAGIAIPADRDVRGGDKKKKLKTAEEYVCTDCGTLDSPEWRKGPSGPKTLCNACGLRWAKKEKKRNSASQKVPRLDQAMGSNIHLGLAPVTALSPAPERHGGCSDSSPVFTRPSGSSSLLHLESREPRGLIRIPDAIKQHQHAYHNDGKGDSNTLGTAAAMQALKMFTQSDGAGSVSGQGAFLGMAMTEASKLFDDKAARGKLQGGARKENVVRQAVETAVKMYLSRGGLAGMAVKFLG